MRVFTTPRPINFAISNSDLARDFIDLSFMLESGRALPVLTRFEGPVTVRVTGNPPPTLEFRSEPADLPAARRGWHRYQPDKRSERQYHDRGGQPRPDPQPAADGRLFRGAQHHATE
jgi:hypothetical protein